MVMLTSRDLQRLNPSRLVIQSELHLLGHINKNNELLEHLFIVLKVGHKFLDGLFKDLSPYKLLFIHSLWDKVQITLYPVSVAVVIQIYTL